MKLLRIGKDVLEKLAEANAQSGNVILVPCCHKGIEGIFVEYDAMMNSFGIFSAQCDALAGFDDKDVLDCTVTMSDDGFTSVFTEK